MRQGLSQAVNCLLEKFLALWRIKISYCNDPNIYSHSKNPETRAIHTHKFTHRGNLKLLLTFKHVFELWEETGVPGENPCLHRKNIKTPHRKTPVWIGTRAFLQWGQKWRTAEPWSTQGERNYPPKLPSFCIQQHIRVRGGESDSDVPWCSP